ncbi:MAG: M1 family aminopeptidase, partial [Pseudomonadota bacterium]
DWRADYERELKAFDAMRPPAIRAVTLTVDIDPLSRRMVVDGEYRLGNISDQPITEFMLSWAQGNTVTYTLAGSREQRRYAALNAVHVTLTEPLLPGETRTLAFTVERINRGFRESEVDNRVVRNGTFINNQELLPRLGFDADQNLTDPQQRTKRGLGVAHGFPALEDTTQYWRTYLGADVQRVELDITIATDLEQIAVAPGRLLREWRDGGRRYFRYQTEQPVLNFFTVLSGEYTVERERHNGIDIEVYHHPTHGMNVARMIEAVRHALDYFGAEFGPYQYRQLRIIEFPRYEQFAQSFANTIPYSEDIGFVADLRSPRTIDYVYSVTAHELAHQWWGHQIAPANVQGGTVLSESLAQYSAYMLIRERYGEAYLRRFLKWEHDRYLRGRSNEVDVEQVLMRTENKPYIHYQKGGLVMWALQDLYGTDRFHAALRSLLAEFRYRDDRHATTLDLLARLRSGANDKELAFLRDSFARITLYDFRIESANGRQRADGRYQVDVTLSGEKSDVAGDGSSTTIALNERIDVALLAEHPDAPLTADGVVSVESQRLTSGQQVLRLISERRPTYIAVDPFLKRIDRTLDDNTMAITWASGVADKRD